MADLLSSLFCWPIRESFIVPTTLTSYVPTLKQQAAANDIFKVLITYPIANITSCAAKSRISNNIQICGGWTQWLAESIHNRILTFISDEANRKIAGEAFLKVWDTAVSTLKTMEEFADEHPILTALVLSIVVLGILCLLYPWVLEILGFAELGPIEGSFAAAWQRMYGGMVPYGSLFSYLQRLAMTRAAWGWAKL